MRGGAPHLAITENPQPLEKMLHCGCENCSNFKEKEFVSSITAFAQELKTARTECSLSFITVPEFAKEHNFVIDTLRGNSESFGIGVINLTKQHSGMVMNRFYT